MSVEVEVSYAGECRGGPLNGRLYSVRSPKGFVTADKTAGRAWIYDRRDDGKFHVREIDGRKLDMAKLIETALTGGYDVVALPGDVSGS